MDDPKLKCKRCGNELVFTQKVEKNDQFYHFFWCIQCQRPTHKITYALTPFTCPKHHEEFMGTEFQDNGNAHEIWHVMRCYRCGNVRKIPRHTTAAGISGRIDIEDPRVSNTLFLNRSLMAVFGDQESKEILPPDDLLDQIYLPDETHI